MSINILGDKKRRRYNEGLFDVVNRKYALEVEEVDPVAGIEFYSLKGISVCSSSELPELWPSESLKNMDDWKIHFSETDKLMASASDLYNIF